MSRTGQWRIGTSGYQYQHWKDRFYPKSLPRKKWFGHFAEHFDTVEINNTFYHLPEASTFDQWRAQAPDHFLYILKYSRYGTHIKHLKDPDLHVTKFLDVAERLKTHLGPILVQLPPRWHCDPQRLETFIKALPGRRRWAFEFRDRSWLNDDIYDLLRRHRAALCIHDMLADHPRILTADWTYLRYHGPGPGGHYPHQSLSAEADRIAEHLRDGLDVYAFFNNDAEGYALKNAGQLRQYVETRLQ